MTTGFIFLILCEDLHGGLASVNPRAKGCFNLWLLPKRSAEDFWPLGIMHEGGGAGGAPARGWQGRVPGDLVVRGLSWYTWPFQRPHVAISGLHLVDTILVYRGIT